MLPEKVDVLVLGGGIIGISLARHLIQGQSPITDPRPFRPERDE